MSFQPNPINPISTVGLEGDPQAPVSYHTHNGIDSPLINPNAGANLLGGEITGTLLTSDDVPKTFLITSLDAGQSCYLFTKMVASDFSDNKFAGFVLGVTFKNNAGTISIIDQIQDMYTMRDETSWDCSYTNSGTNIYLQVQGKLAQTIKWSFSILKIQI